MQEDKLASGEDPLDSIIRETQEEIGVILKKEQIKDSQTKIFRMLVDGGRI